MSTTATPPVALEAVKSTKKAAPQKRTYQLLRARHYDRQGPRDPDAPEKSKDREVGTIRTFQANIKKGEFPIFESTTDLCSPAFNPPGFPPKFKLVVPGDGAPVVMADPMVRQPGETVAVYLARINELMKKAKSTTDRILNDLDKMGQEDLVALAEAEEIDIKSAKNIEEMRHLIRKSLKG